MNSVSEPSQHLVADAEQFMMRIEEEPNHVQHVRFLAVQLFQLFRERLGLVDSDRVFLEAAALLHDIGWSISGTAHHKHSARLILENGLNGASGRELNVIAALARAHRKSSPKLKHKPFGDLEAADRRLVQKLAALLRIADGLERSHCRLISEIRIRYDSNAHLTLLLKCRSLPSAELYGLNKKKALMEELLGFQIHAEVFTDDANGAWSAS